MSDQRTQGRKSYLISWRLRDVRVEQFMTQDELAEASGVHKVTISNIENGKRRTSAKTLKKLAAALDISPYALVIRDDKGSLL